MDHLVQADRCDSCSASAKAIFTLSTGTLMFCRHHTLDYGLKLKDVSLSVFDPDQILFKKVPAF